MDATSLLWGVFFGSIGMGYFMYGKKRSRPVVRYTGIALMIFPYAISDNVILVIVGALLLMLPMFVKEN